MRAFGVTFVAIAVGAVFLPTTLTYFAIVITAVAGCIGMATTYAERRIQRELAQAEDTQKSLDQLALLRSMDDDRDIEWERLLAATTPRPLGSAHRPDQTRLRTVTPRIPSPRQAGDAS